MLLKGDFSFGDEGLGDIVARLTDPLTLLVCLRLRQAETEDDDQKRRAGAEPEELEIKRLAN